MQVGNDAPILLGPRSCGHPRSHQSRAEGMKDPAGYDMDELRRVARYLKKVPRAASIFPEQGWPKELQAWMDADCEGDVITRRSTSGLVMVFGKHRC